MGNRFSSQPTAYGTPNLRLLKSEFANISSVLVGQRRGIKKVDEGIRLVSFMRYDLGDLDRERKTLQPPGNPFGRLSLMF
jgi:hypothetical protein